MKKINTWLTFDDGRRIFCGEMICRNPDDRGWIEGAFRYSPEYLEHLHAFPLDPVLLTLNSEIFEPNRSAGVFAVFEDSLPDDWGRRLLIRKANLSRPRQTVPELLIALGGTGMGALSYFEKDYNKPEVDSASILELDTLLEAALKFEQGYEFEDEEIGALLRAGSSPGGARPKVLIETKDAVQWIAKFPGVKDDYDVVQIEAAAMSLARKANLNVPETRLIAAGPHHVLLVKRFDIADEGGRHHMISMQTLLKAEGWYNLGYRDMFEVLRKYSFQPEVDVPALFRQMVFNALIGNTDDHLKNFTMLHGRNGFYLSPAYDLLPDIANRQEHVLYFSNAHRFPGHKTLLDMGRKLGVSRPQEIVDQIRETVSGWKGEFEQFQVPGHNIDRLAWDFNRRLTG
jgi:serine/threonine-protein kinase HipA